MLFEFYRDRTYFLMPSTRWGFVALERPDVELADEEEDDEDEDGEEDEIDYYGGGGGKGGGGSGRSSHKNGSFSSQSGGGEGDDDDDEEEQQLARDEAALALERAATSSALLVGDSVHWKGADSDLPLGTVGLVTQVYGDGDVEVTFAGAQSDGKVFTFEEVISCATKASAALWGVCLSCPDV